MILPFVFQDWIFCQFLRITFFQVQSNSCRFDFFSFSLSLVAIRFTFWLNLLYIFHLFRWRGNSLSKYPLNYSTLPQTFVGLFGRQIAFIYCKSIFLIMHSISKLFLLWDPLSNEVLTIRSFWHVIEQSFNEQCSNNEGNIN